MKNVLSRHFGLLSSTLRRLACTPFSSLLNITVIGIALSLPVGGYVLLKNVQSLSARFAGEAQISVFLHNHVGKAEIAKISQRLKAHDAIESIEFVPRELALRQLQQSTGLADVIGGLTQNPLPDAFIIHPVAMETEKLELLRDDLKSWPAFEHVQLDSAWAKRLEAILNFARITLWFLAALFSFALTAITFNTIRLQILTQRTEIEVSHLIGATNAFIRRPFLYFGFIQGLLGGVMAWLIIALCLGILNRHLVELGQLYAAPLALHHLTWQDSLTLLGFSAYLGWLGAWLSSSQHLWQIAPR